MTPIADYHVLQFQSERVQSLNGSLAVAAFGSGIAALRANQCLGDALGQSLRASAAAGPNSQQAGRRSPYLANRQCGIFFYAPGGIQPKTNNLHN